MILKTMAGLFLWLVCCAISTAETPAPATQPDKAETPPATQPMRDPTQADAALARVLNETNPGDGRLPQVTFMGVIVVASQQPEAMISVKGSGTFIVHEGSMLTTSDNRTNTILRVVHVLPDSVEIAVDSLNQTMIVR